MSELMSFNFDNNQITAVIYDGKPAFVAMDVARALGYIKPQSAIKRHCKSLIKIKYGEMLNIGFKPKPQGVTLMLLCDLCNIVLKSKNYRFLHWFKEEVCNKFSEYNDLCETISSLSVVSEKIRNNGIREKTALTTIEQLQGVKLIRQYPVLGKYRIDGYDPVNNIAYEIDEEQHFTPQHTEADRIREKEISAVLGCKFVRIIV
ncbi:hypothetical protein mEp044_12 [Escherichia phage mEp044]